MIEFIKALETDTELIEDLARKTWPNTFGKVMSKEQIDYMLDLIYNKSALLKQMNSEHIFVLIKYNNKSVGYTSYELNYKKQPQLMIHKVYLLPSSQGLGGKHTFNHLTEIAKRNQQIALTLKVFHKNENAIQFYLKKGFDKVGEVTSNIGKGYTILDFVMKKDI